MSVFKGSGKPIARGPQPTAVSAPWAGTTVTLPPPATPFSVHPVTPGLSLASRDVVDNPLRRLGFYFALAFVFLRFSFLHELLVFKLGVDLHLVQVVGIPAVLLTLFAGGIQRTLQARMVFYWLGFALWLVLATPFSSWRGGSLELVSGYFKAEVPVLFVIGGMILTWKEFQKVMLAMAVAGAFNVLTGRYFQAADDGGGRLRLEFGGIANSNDFAAHLLFVLPFLLFAIMAVSVSWKWKVPALLFLLGGFYLASQSASRGALIAFGAISCFILLRGTIRQRAIFAITVVGLVVLSVATLPRRTLIRYATIFGGSAAEDQEANDSQRARTYLFKSSLRYTLEHPLLGVGPGEFSDFEGNESRARGEHGSWQVTHNAYTQVSSEAGIPALIFMLGGILSTFLALSRVYKTARKNRAFRNIAAAAYCLQLALIGFGVATAFLSLAYTVYLPALTGMAIALSAVAQSEFARATPGQIQPRTR